MLDSDTNLILPNVRFYQKEDLNNYETAQQGRPIYRMVDFVRIEIPGNQLSIIDTYANDDHKAAYPIQWARYQNEKKDLGEAQIDGTLLRDWSILTAAQVKELAHFHFYTVDQVSMASDEQISKITQIVGMSGHSFRDKAKAYLNVAKDSAHAMAQADELRKRDAEIEALKEQMQELLAAKQAEQPKRGRPAQEKLEKVE